MKFTKFNVSIILLLVFFVPVHSQALPSNFDFKRDTGQVSGLPIFILTPSVDSVAYDAMNGNTFEVLSAIAQPDANKFGISFMNAKKTYQFSTNRNKSCTLTIDKENFEYPKYTMASKNVLAKLRIETAVFSINKEVFEKLVKADDVLIRCGIVKYNLDQDNIDALRYLSDQIEQDSSRKEKN